MKLDFHIHSRYSIDSFTSPKSLVALSKKLGVRFAITDHNSIAGHQEFRKLGAEFIPGEEISTSKGDLIGLYLNECIPKKTDFAEAVDLIHEQGGVAYLPHMFDITRHGVSDFPAAKKVDIIEVFNARCMPQSFNEKARLFAEKNKLLMGAGSDSHLLWEFGKTYTELPEFDITSPKELLKAMKKSKIHGVPTSLLYARGPPVIIKLWKKITGKF